MPRQLGDLARWITWGGVRGGGLGRPPARGEPATTEAVTLPASAVRALHMAVRRRSPRGAARGIGLCCPTESGAVRQSHLRMYERWLPPGIDGDPEMARRARLIVTASLTTTGLTAGLSVARFASDGYRFGPAWILLVVTAGALLVPPLLRRLGLGAAGPVLPILGLIATASMALVERGLQSEAMFWFVLLPLVAAFLAGAPVVPWFVGACLVTAFTIFALGIAGVPGDVPVMSKPSQVLFFFGCAGATMFSGALGWLFERGRERALDEISAREREIRDLLRVKGEFVSVVSHELRTPLTSIRGGLGLLRGMHLAELSAEGQDLLSLCTRNVDRLGVLIDDLLDVQALTSGQFELKPDWVSIATLIRSCVETNSGYAATRGVRLEILEPIPDGFIHGDERRLQQVMANLISNAVKYSSSKDPVTLGALGTDGRVEISVSDRGPGIPEEFQQRMFKAFSQADSKTTRERGGTGLGLYISQAIVERHGGSIRFETSAGAGTTFFVRLPVGSPPDSASDPA